MFRIFALSAILVLFASATIAQNVESRFSDYDEYVKFVDRNMKARNIISLLKRLGGKDEYTDVEMKNVQGQMRNIWRSDFKHVRVFNRRELGGGLWEEGRVYWTGLRYGYFYALLHERDDGLVVVRFSVNTQIGPILEKF